MVQAYVRAPPRRTIAHTRTHMGIGKHYEHADGRPSPSGRISIRIYLSELVRYALVGRAKAWSDDGSPQQCALGTYTMDDRCIVGQLGLVDSAEGGSCLLVLGEPAQRHNGLRIVSVSKSSSTYWHFT